MKATNMLRMARSLMLKKKSERHIENRRVQLVMKTEIVSNLNTFGFSNVHFTSSYAFKCDQIGRKCPCCSQIHDRNAYFVKFHEPSGNWYVKNFSKKCVSKPFLQKRHELPKFAFVL